MAIIFRQPPFSWPYSRLSSPLLHQKAMLCLMLARLIPVAASQRGDHGCQLQRAEVSGSTGEGDILIGGIFGVHMGGSIAISYTTKPSWLTCTKFSYQSFQYLQAMMFAIEEINRNTELLPNVTLGFRLFDSCMRMQQVLEGTFWMLTERKEPIPNYRCRGRQPLAGIVGDTTSSFSIPMARVLGLYRYPQQILLLHEVAFALQANVLTGIATDINFTKISYFATSPLLSDRYQFPSFFRTIPSDDFQARGLAQLVIYFRWTWVGLIAADNDYGQHGINILQQELVKTGTCIAFSETIIKNESYQNAFYIATVIKSSTAKAIIIFSSDTILNLVMDELVNQNITGKVWIATESWSTSALLSTEKYAHILTGTIGFAIHSTEMPGFKKFLISNTPSKFQQDILMKEFWERVFNCTWLQDDSALGFVVGGPKPCSWDVNQNILTTVYTELINPRVAYNVYSAVYALVLALQDLNSCRLGKGPFYKGTCADTINFKPWQLLHYVKHMRTPNTASNEAFFDSGGNLPAQYDIVNWQEGAGGTIKQVKVGRYDGSASQGKKFHVNSSEIIWTAGSRQMPASVCSLSCPPGYRMASRPGEPICCFQCVLCPQGEISNRTDSIECTKCRWSQWPNEKQDECITKTIEFLSYEEPLGITLASVSILLSVVPVAIIGLFSQYRNTPIVRANNRSLSYLLLLSLTLCFLCSLGFIGYPTLEKCLLRQAAFGTTFALCVSCILAKTILVVIAFNATKPSSNLRKWTGPKLSYVVISASTIIQVILCVSWLIPYSPFPEYDIRTVPGKIIVQCNEGSLIAFWCMLGYLGFLVTVSFIVAFLARKLPDNFNEAQFITFSMLAFLSVWLSFIPAYLSTRGKYTVAMEVFAILSSGSALLFCIFLPKCYIILLKPEINSREHLMGRGKSNIITVN